MFIGLAIGTFVGVLIGANLKSINRGISRLVKFSLKYGFYAMAIYGIVQVVF